MNIHLYLNDEDQTPIVSFYDMQANPFKVGDIISLGVDELYPAEYAEYKEEFRIKLLKDNKETEDKFNRKRIEILRESKHVDFKVIYSPTLTIEYFCSFIQKQ